MAPKNKIQNLKGIFRKMITYAVLRKSWDVGKVQSVWVSRDELFSTVWIWWNGTNDLGVGVFELGVSTEFLSLSLVSVCVCHGVYLFF
tara:strand:+ start:2112 stop:2375 length:264 start_codon:yes stop_codon:yes gene_type:complete